MYSSFDHTEPSLLHTGGAVMQPIISELSSTFVTTDYSKWLVGLGTALKALASEIRYLSYGDDRGVTMVVDLAEGAKILTQTAEHLSCTGQTLTLNRLTTEISKRCASSLDLIPIIDAPDIINFLVSCSYLGPCTTCLCHSRHSL
jgi:hypothetical protein